MDKTDGATEKSDADAPWGTLEELLLACAVDRHGTDCWDSVAIEIQKRSSNSTFHHLLTPHHCKQRYQDLERRYAPKHDASDDDEKKADTVRWLEELRKLRVAELRRELERYDLSIVSLQRKVKRLKEEGEEDPREGENGEGTSDLAGREQEEEKRGGTESGPGASPESDRDNQSVNESNSTDPKAEDNKARADEPEPAGVEKAEPDQSGLSKKPIEDDSCNGSSVDRDRNSVKAEQEEAGPSESQAESEEGTSKLSSDMQSSASRFRKKGETDKVRSGSVSGEERENEDQSVAVKRLSRKSQPYMEILEMVRSHKLGSVFERRLESQDTPEYRKLIRQHMDLESILRRHKEGQYSGCYKKMYRDLLLLFTNAIIFFGKKSKEHAAAKELLDLVSKEVAQRKLKPNPSAEEPAPVAARPLSPKAELEPSDSLLRKPNMSGPIIVCRKRSSIAAKGPRSSSGAADTKREPKPEEKPKFDWSEPSKSSGSGEEARITKKRIKDRLAPASSNLKKSSENVAKPNPNKPNPDKNSEEAGKVGGGGSSSSKNQKPKTDNSASVSGAKKRSAADFLNRIKQNSSPNKGPLVDTSKNSAGSSKNKGGSDPKKSGGGGGKGDDGKTDQASRRGSDDGKTDQASRRGGEEGGKTEQGSRRGSTGRMVKEQGSPTKRSAGRPPKRAAAPVPATAAPAVSGKRNRERVDDVKNVASKQQPKKRARK